jgi:site-specific DNA recombinase
MVEVPALVSKEIFAAVQAQLEENRMRKRAEQRCDRYLLQGLVVCKRCGYACCAAGLQPASRKTKEPYSYYRCLGSDKFRSGGQRTCWNKAVRTDFLDAAVWEDVRGLLSEPERIRAEYQRRRQRKKPGSDREADQLTKLIAQVKKSISRLIDAYGDGLLEKLEFEPRVTAARERLSRLEQEEKEVSAHKGQDAELRLVIGQLEEFAERVSDGLRQPTWATRRQIVRALVKQVEIDQDEVRIVYRLGPPTDDGGLPRGDLQHRPGREVAKNAKIDHPLTFSPEAVLDHRGVPVHEEAMTWVVRALAAFAVNGFGETALLPEEREEIGSAHERPRGERLNDKLARARLGVHAPEDDLAL